MKPGESLRSYVNYIQRQMVLVYNYNEEVAVAAFISRLQITLSFYMRLVKKDVTKMRDILIRVQKHTQIKKAIRCATNRPQNKNPRLRRHSISSPKEESKSRIHRRSYTTQTSTRAEQGR